MGVNGRMGCHGRPFGPCDMEAILRDVATLPAIPAVMRSTMSSPGPCASATALTGQDWSWLRDVGVSRRRAAAAVRRSASIPRPFGTCDVGISDAGCVAAGGVVPAQLDIVEQQAGDGLEVVGGWLGGAEQAAEAGDEANTEGTQR